VVLKFLLSKFLEIGRLSRRSELKDINLLVDFFFH
jgi:hypothetical protein